MKRCSTSLIFKDANLKTPKQYIFTYQTDKDVFFSITYTVMGGRKKEEKDILINITKNVPHV